MKRLVRILNQSIHGNKPAQTVQVCAYTRDVNCVICNFRKPRRYCPGVKGDICSICCGTEREQSVDCPLECPFLQDAHEHERLPELDRSTVPNQDIELTEEFLESNEVLLAFLSMAVYEGAMKSPGITDYDVREALEVLVRTYRTRQSGLYYDTVPENRFAATIATTVYERLGELERREIEASGSSSLRDKTVLGVLVFLQRLEYSNNNGRKRSRAFIDFLRRFYVPMNETEEDDDEQLVEPESPRIIL